jgi:hypothetical protein
MDFLNLATVAAPFVALAAVLAEIVVKKPSVLAELLQDSETFARTPLAANVAVAGREVIPANDRTKFAA